MSEIYFDIIKKSIFIQQIFFYNSRNDVLGKTIGLLLSFSSRYLT